MSLHNEHNELIINRISSWYYIEKITTLVIFINLIKKAVFYTKAEAEGTSNLFLVKLLFISTSGRI